MNGAKLRACQHLIGNAAAAGKTRVVSAASVLSPQNAMAATVAAANGMTCTVILGGTKPETAPRHPAVRIAAEAGAGFEFIPVGYNPCLQRAAADATAADAGAYWLRYGITTPPGATVAELAAFHATAGDQTANLPPRTRTLVIPFGSGNTAAGVLYGLSKHAPRELERVVLVGIGPDRRQWLAERLAALDVALPYPIEHIDLHGSGYAAYGDKMPATEDGIVMHPTYEGKVVRWLNEHWTPWWETRDSTTCMWIVGGPLAA